ncbi:alpha/beta hydrolase [Synergistales bacterium]|nr:alpha/beta hydrolase [Synergistales bacterium]
MPTTILNNLTVNYFDSGSGEAVVFLHGWGCSFSIFEPFLNILKSHRRVVALDLPGFGESGEPPHGWSLDEYADFTEGFLSRVGVKSAVMIGHSFGGRIIIKLASRKERRVKITKAVLIGSAGVRPPRTLKKRARAAFYKLGRRVLSAGFIKRRFPDLLERWRLRTASADYRNASPIMRESLVKVVNEDLTPLLPSVPCPTLLIWGGGDTATPLSDGKTMERLIPDAGLVVYGGAGHYSFLERKAEVLAVLNSFLGTAAG